MLRSLDLGFYQLPSGVVGQLQAKLPEDLRLVVGVGVLHNSRDIGEPVDHRLDPCPWFRACGRIGIHDSGRPFKLHGIHKFLGTRRDPLQGVPEEGVRSHNART
jgi:hypothetical protein